MKKIVAITLAMLMLLLVVGCTISDTGSDTGTTQPSSGTTSPSTTTEAATTKATTAATTAPSNEPTIQEQVILEQDDIIITAKSIEDSWMGPELKVLIENNSNSGIMVQARDVSVNDIMVSDMFSADVAAGKKSNDGITFMLPDAAGIEIIKKIEMRLVVMDGSTWNTILETEPIVLETSADYVQQYNDSGEEIMNAEDIRVVFQDIDSDSLWGADLVLFIDNGRKDNVTVQVRDVSVNGFMVTAMFSADVMSGKKAYDSISFLSSELTENGIDELEEIEFRFTVLDAGTWKTIYDSEIVTINLK